MKVAPNYHFGAFINTPGAVSIGAFNDGFTAWQPLSANAGGQVWFTGGNVGIGTVQPGSSLHVATDATVGPFSLPTYRNWPVYCDGCRLRVGILRAGRCSPGQRPPLQAIYLSGTIRREMRVFGRPPSCCLLKSAQLHADRNQPEEAERLFTEILDLERDWSEARNAAGIRGRA